MNEQTLNYDLAAFANPIDRRKAKEHMLLHETCNKSDKISYRVIGDRTHPPEAYEIHFRVRSILGIDDRNMPLYGNNHKAEIHLPANYPIEGPKIFMTSQVWHPNIKHKGTRRVCSNSDQFGLTYDLGELVLRIGEILQYKNYHAINVAPFPEDETVARWVRDFAEPNDIVNKSKGIYTDDSPLIEMPTARKVDMQQKSIRGRVTIRRR